jgi:hypothetical protein
MQAILIRKSLQSNRQIVVGTKILGLPIKKFSLVKISQKFSVLLALKKYVIFHSPQVKVLIRQLINYKHKDKTIQSIDILSLK